MFHSMYHTLCAKMSSFQLLLVYFLVIKIDTYALENIINPKYIGSQILLLNDLLLWHHPITLYEHEYSFQEYIFCICQIKEILLWRVYSLLASFLLVYTDNFIVFFSQ